MQWQLNTVAGTALPKRYSGVPQSLPLQILGAEISVSGEKMPWQLSGARFVLGYMYSTEKLRPLVCVTVATRARREPNLMSHVGSSAA
jgi:hypothetical protein